MPWERERTQSLGAEVNQTQPDRPPARPLPAYLRDRHRFWHAHGYAENRAWYQRLADKGQHPRAMVVGCCDSRVDIVQLFGAEPGDLFVVRNVASLIPPHNPDHSHHGTSAAAEYAVTSLKVAHILVVGHSNCGGVKACYDMCAGDAPELAEGPSYVGRWMEILRPGYERVAEIAGADERLRALEQEGVLTSLRNLMSFPFVSRAVREGELTLHGGWLDIATGDLKVYDRDEDAFV